MKKKWLMLLAVVVALVAGWFLFRGAYQNNLNPFASYEDLMSADNYGGKTPEETLELLIKALKANDAKLASKYFILDESGGRKAVEGALEEAKERGELSLIGEKLGSAAPNLDDITHPGDFKYVVFDEQGRVEAVINMELNSYSGVWKIESL